MSRPPRWLAPALLAAVCATSLSAATPVGRPELLTPDLSHLEEASREQLAASAANLAPPHEIGSMRPMGTTADIITGDLAAKAGFLEVPNGPGLGVELDMAAVREYLISSGEIN